MESYRVKITENARRDLRDTYSYINKELKVPEAAQRFYIDTLNSIYTLDKMPECYPIVRDERLAEKGYRQMLVKNHIVFYTIDNEKKIVIVMRILYGRRDWLNI